MTLKLFGSSKSKLLYESLRSARIKYPDVPEFIFNKFLKADKSKTYKYIEKMCQFFDEGYNYLAVISNIIAYQKLENYVDNKDITNKTYTDILNDIEDGKLKKATSLSQLRKASKLSGLIYDKNKIRIYKIDSFDEAKDRGKSTKWCTSLNKDNFDLWIDRYNMYIIEDLNKEIDSPFRKICFLVNKIEDCFVTADNRHYFDSEPEYYQLKDYFGPEILNSLL